MQRLKRVFNIDIDLRAPCGAGQNHRLYRPAGVAPPAVVERILAHLRGKAPSAELAMLPEDRAPPQARLGAPDCLTDSMTP